MDIESVPPSVMSTVCVSWCCVHRQCNRSVLVLPELTRSGEASRRHCRRTRESFTLKALSLSGIDSVFLLFRFPYFLGQILYFFKWIALFLFWLIPIKYFTRTFILGLPIDYQPTSNQRQRDKYRNLRMALQILQCTFLPEVFEWIFFCFCSATWPCPRAVSFPNTCWSFPSATTRAASNSPKRSSKKSTNILFCLVRRLITYNSYRPLN